MAAAEQAAGNTDELTSALQAAREGDEGAFRTVYRAVHPGLLRYIRGLVGEHAEDVASEAWLQIARGLSGFDGDGDAFRGWTAKIARNRALDHIRYERRRPSWPVPVELLSDQADSTDTSVHALGAVASERALALINSLPPDQAEAVLLRVVMGLDAKTAAQVLGKRAGAVRTACYRGLRRLAELIDESEAVSRPDEDGGVTPTVKRTLKGTR